MFVNKLLAPLQRWMVKSKANQPQVLVIDDWIPDPSIGAGAPRAAYLLKALVEAGVAVTHFSTSISPTSQTTIVHAMPTVSFWTRSGSRADDLRRFLRSFQNRFDVILVSRPHNLVAFNEAKLDNPTSARMPMVIYDAEAIFSQRDILQRIVTREPLSDAASQTLIDSEVDLAKDVDIVLTVNEDNADLFRTSGHADVRVLRHAVFDKLGRKPHSDRETILFIGPTYADETPNADAVVWFVKYVLPMLQNVREQKPRLTIVGHATAPTVMSLPRQVVDLRGPIQDLEAEYAKAIVFVAPTRFAAGIPLKVYEAASRGVPCVVTPLLAKQLGWSDERHVLVADTPELYARQCRRLIDDSSLWERIRMAALEQTLRDCDWPTFKATVQDVVSLKPPTKSGAHRAQHPADS